MDRGNFGSSEGKETKVVRPTLKKSRYGIALFFTFVVFLLGILIGYSLTQSRIEFSEKIGKQQRLEFDSLQLQYLFMTELLEESNCQAALKTLDENLKNLELARERLEKFLEADDEEELKGVKREYTLAEIRYWFLSKKSKEICTSPDSITVLYFYASKDCNKCEAQGAILTSLKDIFRDRLLIFSLDILFTEEPLIHILTESFNIDSAPSLVINDLSLKEFVKKQELKEIICAQYREKPHEC